MIYTQLFCCFCSLVTSDPRNKKIQDKCPLVGGSVTSPSICMVISVSDKDYSKSSNIQWMFPEDLGGPCTMLDIRFNVITKIHSDLMDTEI